MPLSSLIVEELGPMMQIGAIPAPEGQERARGMQPPMTKTALTIRFTARLCAPAEGGDWTFLRLRTSEKTNRE